MRSILAAVRLALRAILRSKLRASLTVLGILIGKRHGCGFGKRALVCGRGAASDGHQHALDGPTQVRGGGSGCQETCRCPVQKVVEVVLRCLQGGQVHTKTGARANQSGAAHRHVLDSLAHVIDADQVD